MADGGDGGFFAVVEDGRFRGDDHAADAVAEVRDIEVDEQAHFVACEAEQVAQAFLVGVVDTAAAHDAEEEGFFDEEVHPCAGVDADSLVVERERCVPPVDDLLHAEFERQAIAVGIPVETRTQMPMHLHAGSHDEMRQFLKIEVHGRGW